MALAIGGFYFYQNFLARSPEADRTGDGAPLAGPAVRTPDAVREPATVPAGASRLEDEEAAQRKREFETAQGVLKQRLALAKLKQKQVLDVGGQVSEAALAWRTELDRWDDETAALLLNDKGKALAANKPYVKRFRAVYDADRPGREEATRLTAMAEGIVSAVKTSHDNPADGSAPPDEMLKQLLNLLQQAKDSRDKNREARERIETLVSTAIGAGEKGAIPLKEAIRAEEQAESLAQVAAIEAEMEQARVETTAKLAAARADAARSAGELEAQRERQRAQGFRADTTREADDAKAKAQMAEFRRRAREPEVRQVLMPFVSAGYAQPCVISPIGVCLEKGVEHGPMALSRLKTVGALERSTEGLTRLNRLASGDLNDRPRWHFDLHNTHLWARSTQPFIQRAQDLLNELGPALVEEGLLAP